MHADSQRTEILKRLIGRRVQIPADVSAGICLLMVIGDERQNEL